MAQAHGFHVAAVLWWRADRVHRAILSPHAAGGGSFVISAEMRASGRLIVTILCDAVSVRVSREAADRARPRGIGANAPPTPILFARNKRIRLDARHIESCQQKPACTFTLIALLSAMSSASVFPSLHHCRAARQLDFSRHRDPLVAWMTAPFWGLEAGSRSSRRAASICAYIRG